MTYEGYKKGDVIDAPDLWIFGAKVVEVKNRVLTVETYNIIDGNGRRDVSAAACVVIRRKKK
jgi:hypothetical protein